MQNSQTLVVTAVELCRLNKCLQTASASNSVTAADTTTAIKHETFSLKTCCPRHFLLNNKFVQNTIIRISTRTTRRDLLDL